MTSEINLGKVRAKLFSTPLKKYGKHAQILICFRGILLVQIKRGANVEKSLSRWHKSMLRNFHISQKQIDHRPQAPNQPTFWPTSVLPTTKPTTNVIKYYKISFLKTTKKVIYIYLFLPRFYSFFFK